MSQVVLLALTLAVFCSVAFAAAPEWINLSLQDKRVLHSVVLHNNKVYIAGGTDTNSEVLSSVEILDTQSLSWTYANLTKGRSLMASIVCNDMIIFAGGRGDDAISMVDIFDTAAGRWSNTSFPLDIEGMDATCIGDRYAVFAGGQMRGAFSPFIHVFDTVTQMWNQLSTTMQPARWLPRVDSYQNLVLISGGYLNVLPFGYSNTIDVINVLTGERIQVPPMPSTRVAHSTFIFNDRLFVVGGLTHSGASSVTNNQIDILNLDTWIWEPSWTSPIPSNISTHGFALPTGQLAFISDKAEMAIYTPASRTFAKVDISVPNFERLSMGAVLTDTMIVLAGGWIRMPNVTDSYTVNHVNIYRYLDAPLPPVDLPPSQRVATPNPSVVPILDCVRNINDVTYVGYFGYDNPTSASQFIPVGDNNKFTPDPSVRGQVDVFGAGRSSYYPLSPFQIIFTSDANQDLVWQLGSYVMNFKPSDPSLACAQDIVFVMEIVFSEPPNSTVFKAVNQRLADMIGVPLERISIKTISAAPNKELTYIVEFIITAPTSGKDLSSAEILRRLTQQFKTNPDSIPVLIQADAPTVKGVTRLEGVPPPNPRVGFVPPASESAASEMALSISATLALLIVIL